MPRSTPQGLGIPELTADLPPRSVVPIDPRSQGEHDRRLDQFRSARQLGQVGGEPLPDRPDAQTRPVAALSLTNRLRISPSVVRMYSTDQKPVTDPMSECTGDPLSLHSPDRGRYCGATSPGKTSLKSAPRRIIGAASAHVVEHLGGLDDFHN
jgi:hypothetical protein